MPRTRWIRNNSYKYKLQIILVLSLFLILSGCGLIIKDMFKVHENTDETTDFIEFEIIYQGFYYENDSTKIFGAEFKFNDLISVTVNSTSNIIYNDNIYYFPNDNIYSRDANFKNYITPPGLNTITKQSTLNLTLDLEVTITYEATNTQGSLESTNLTLEIFENISTDTSNVSKLKLIIGLDASGNLVYDLLKDDDFDNFVDVSGNEGIYYVFHQTSNSIVFYSTLLLNEGSSKIYYPSSWEKFDFPFPY